MKRSIAASFFAALAGLLALCCPITSPAAPGDLYVAGYDDHNYASVFRFTPNGTRSTFATGLYQPIAIAFDRKGNLFVADSGSGIPQMESFIYKFALDGTRTTFASLSFYSPYGITFDGAGNLFVAAGGQIFKFTPDGTMSVFASDVHPWPLAFDKAGILYVGANLPGPGAILKFASDGTSSVFVNFPPPSDLSSGLAFDPKGNLFVKRTGPILKLAPDRTTTIFVADDRFNYPLAFDNEGTLFACPHAYSQSEPTIVKFAPDGTRTTFAFPPPYFPTALAFEPVTEKLRNLSARGLVGSGEDVLMIGGFIVGGNALANNAVVLRALGPSLAGSGVANVLTDPMLELRDASGAIIVSNDNWQDDPVSAGRISASGLAPANPNESAIYSTLPQGNYTAIVRGAHGTTGTALVEIYSINQ